MSKNRNAKLVQPESAQDLSPPVAPPQDQVPPAAPQQESEIAAPQQESPPVAPPQELVENNNPAASQPGTAILNVQPGKVLRGARASWYAVLLAHQGKTLAEFMKFTTENPPSRIVKATSNRFDEPETPQYRIRFFVRSGILTFMVPKQ